MREYLLEENAAPVPFIGTITMATDPVAAANKMRQELGMVDGWAQEHSTLDLKPYWDCVDLLKPSAS